MNVVVATSELLVIFDRDEDVKIAGRAAVVSRLPFCGHAKARAFVDTGGNLHRQLALLADAAGSVARHARILDHLSRAAALRACSSDRKKALRISNLSATCATAAGDR